MFRGDKWKKLNRTLEEKLKARSEGAKKGWRSRRLQKKALAKEKCPATST
jgi:hypothetical protein